MDEVLMEADGADDGKQFRSTRKLPGTQLFSMSLAIVVESCHITICYTIGVYMVHCFLDNSADESQIGTLTGLLSSFYSLAQLTTAFAWGMVSDRYGRKRLIVMSNLFSTVSMVMFGLAGNYTMAAISRVIGGWFNCSFTNVRSMIGESTDFSSQTVAMGYLGTAFGVGVILGPLIGGALAYPCDNFGSSFPLCGANQLNAQRPFFVPCLCAALISAVATLSNIIILKETLPRVVEAQEAAKEAKLQDEEKPLLESNGKESGPEPAIDIEDTRPVRTLPQKVSTSAHELRLTLTGGLDGHQSIPSAQSRPDSFQSRFSMGASPADVPWFQVGTPFLVSTEISASVADDIVEYQHYRRSRAARSVPGPEAEPEPSRPKTFLRRLASEAAAAPLEAADIESNAFDPYDARGSRAVRGTPSLTRPSMQRPARRPAPARVSLLSRSLPEERRSVLTSVFGEPEQQGALGSSSNDVTLGSSNEAQSAGVPPKAVPKAYAAIAEATPSAESYAMEQDGVKDAAGAEQTKDDTEIKWYKDPVVLLGVAGYTMICFMFNMLDELTPIFAAAPISRGGLDFSSSQLSLPLSISGVALMVWSLVFFPMVQRCLGARTCAVFGLATTVFLSVALGCTSYLAKANVSVSGIVVALTVIMVLKACFQQLCFPTSMAIVNRFAPPSKRGAVNGTAQSLASGVRALGPFLGGLMWAVFSGLPTPGSQLIPFFIISVTAAATIIIYYFLPAI